MLNRYQIAMQSIDLSPSARQRIENRLSAAARTAPRRRVLPRAALAAAVFAVLLIGGALASGANVYSFFSGGVSDGHLVADEMEILVRVCDDRLLLSTPEGEIDVTDRCSDSTPYVYSFTDADGAQHYIIVGGTAEKFGFVEYIRDDATGGFDGQGWLGENDAETIETPEWLVVGEQMLSIRP